MESSLLSNPFLFFLFFRFVLFLPLSLYFFFSFRLFFRVVGCFACRDFCGWTRLKMDHARASREALSNGDSGKRCWQCHLSVCRVLVFFAFFYWRGRRGLSRYRACLLVVFSWKVLNRARGLNWGEGCNVASGRNFKFQYGGSNFVSFKSFSILTFHPIPVEYYN